MVFRQKPSQIEAAFHLIQVLIPKTLILAKWTTTTYSVYECGDNQPTSMPRLGSAFANEMYIVGKDDRIMGKSKIAVGKIAVKN